MTTVSIATIHVVPKYENLLRNGRSKAGVFFLLTITTCSKNIPKKMTTW